MFYNDMYIYIYENGPPWKSQKYAFYGVFEKPSKNELTQEFLFNSRILVNNFLLDFFILESFPSRIP